MYQRWEYADLPHSNSRLLMQMNPDGTAQMEYYGSGSYFMPSYFYAKPVPSQDTQVVGIATGHHGTPRSGRLLVVDPNTILRTSEGQIAYAGDVTWLSIALNEEKFKGFLGEVMTLLELPEPPEPGKKCAWCQYREESRLYGL